MSPFTFFGVTFFLSEAFFDEPLYVLGVASFFIEDLF
jgi:hypothetical protein